MHRIRWKRKKALDRAYDAAAAAGTLPHNNIYDAIRHSYWSAMLTRDMGRLRAKAWADAHEYTSTSHEETCMDQFNNEVGRRIATQLGAGYGAPNDDALWQAVLNSTSLMEPNPFDC